jgi:hypothetical protein
MEGGVPKFLELHPSVLLLDPQNPRLGRVEESQVDTLHDLWQRLPTKLLGLARHIAEKGLDPTARLLVIPSSAPAGTFTVLEGNRRIAALRALEDVDSVRERLAAGQLKKLATSAEAYRKAPIDKVSCVVFDNRQEAADWIELRHTPDTEGAGVLMWGAAEKARFKARQGVAELAVQVIELVREHGQIDDSTRKALDGRYLTTLRRVLNDPQARKDLGVTKDGEGKLQLEFPGNQSVKALTRVVTDLATSAKDVSHVYYKKDRREYIASLPDLPDPKNRLSKPLGVAAAIVAGGGAPARPAKAGKGGPSVIGAPGPRKKLVPGGLRLTIPSKRMAKIFRELREMSPDDYPNAIAVLLRVFLELSVDDFILDKGLMSRPQWSKAGLTEKLKKFLAYVLSSNLMTKQDLQPIRRALLKNRLMGASIESLHAYVHNAKYIPKADDLRDAWDDFQPLFVTIWK